MYSYSFSRTSDAIAQIDDRLLRKDFADILTDVEFALSNNKVDLANLCIERLRVLAHSLCRTIGGPCAVAIIEGLAADGAGADVEALMLPNWTAGRICNTSGTYSCESRKNYTYHSDPTGCISTGTGISAAYSWGIALLSP